MKTSLSQINQNLLELYQYLESLDGELPESLEDYYIKTHEEFASKIEDYSVILDQYDYEIEKSKEFATKFSKRAKTLENSKNYVADIVHQSLKKFGQNSKTPKGLDIFSIDIDGGIIELNPTQSVEISDQDKIDVKYLKGSLELKDLTYEQLEYLKLTLADDYKLVSDLVPKKKEIKDALDNKEEIEGASFKVNYSLKKKLKHQQI